MLMETLDEERRFFEEKKPELLASHEGKFALIKGREVFGIFDTQDRAYAEGLRLFGNVPMLIALVRKDEPKASFPALHLGLIRADIQG
jgi:hypothetical protein